MALDIANVIWGYGSAAADFDNFAPSLALFGVGLVLFTAHYLMLRGFYALEQTRRVFWIQCAHRGHQHRRGRPAHPWRPAGRDRAAAGDRLRLLLRRRRRHLLRDALAQVGGLAGRRLVRFLVRLLIAVGIGAAAAWGLREVMGELVPGDGKLHAVLDLAVVGAGASSRSTSALARLLRITEVTDVMSAGHAPSREQEVTPRPARRARARAHSALRWARDHRR